MNVVELDPVVADVREPQIGEHMDAEHFSRLPKFASKYELVREEVRMSPAGLKHDNVAAKLIMKIGLYLERNPIGEFYATSAGFRVNQDTVLSPDGAFVRTEQLPAAGSPDSFGNFAPDLAIEVVSPSDSALDVDEKIELYLAHGTRLVWVISPRLKSATIHRANRSIQRIRADDALDGEDVLPGFKCVLREIL